MTMLIDNSEITEAQRGVYADILSQAITGEVVGALNFATLAGLHDEVDDALAAVEHAETERTHALAFRAAARSLEIPVIENLNAPYWARIRSSFLQWAAARDKVACIVIQEVMLESFAVAIYAEVGASGPGRLGTTFSRIAAEEQEHLSHSIAYLAAEREKEPDAFDQKLEQIHDDVMTVLAEMVAREDSRGHCGLCHGSCVKQSLGAVNLDLCELRGHAINRYLSTLDEIGVRGERSLQWLLRLPR
jgi:fatty aldehyde decarbonylase